MHQSRYPILPIGLHLCHRPGVELDFSDCDGKRNRKEQWLNYSRVGGGTLHFFPSLSFLSLPQSSPLFSLPLPIQARSQDAARGGHQLFVVGHCVNERQQNSNIV